MTSQHKAVARVMGATFAASFLFAASCTVDKVGPEANSVTGRERGAETQKDLPAGFSNYYGQNRSQSRDAARKLARVNLKSDLNYDGVIGLRDPADGGAFESTPPGLILATGELVKFQMDIRPYRVDFNGRAKVQLSVSGINRAVRSGEFESLDQEVASVGRIRVYTDAQKSNLILDSANPNKRIALWTIDDDKYPANIPGIVPRVVYVEGVKPSGQYQGDLRLLFKVFAGESDEAANNEGRSGYSWTTFQPAYDHVLLTVATEPHRKEFVNNNAEGVWK